MRLTSIEISGFKSFAKRIHLSFETGVTGIIGPNGSGKSNIAEAIAWVLGEQSNKALRGKERTDIIHSGKNTRAIRAHVALTFDNEAARFPVLSSEISISRSLTKEGESEYLLNNEPIRLVDLSQMLAEAGIGTKGYAVISQGMADRYLQATPQARKELFNEATGIKSLQIKIHQAIQKLEKTKRYAEEVRMVLTELIPRITFLERQVTRYGLRDEYIATFQSKQLLWYRHAWHEAKKSLEKINTDWSTWKSRIDETKTQRLLIEQSALRSLQAVPQNGRDIPPNNRVQAAQSLLENCRTILQDMLAHKAVDTHRAQDVLASIEAFFASLTALEHQKRSASKQRVIYPTADIEKARGEEIHAQREESAIAIAQDQAQKDLALLEQEILREFGTKALAMIATSLPADQEPPTPGELQSLSSKIAAIGEKDPLVVKEYEEAKLRHDSLANQLSDIERTMASIEQSIQETSDQMRRNFQEQFARIQSLFRSFFTQLFGGGSAELSVSEDGIDITVVPPNKRPRHIGLLSGGEKTLTSLALLFAILEVQNPPFIVFDEVDAALDEANSKRFADLLRSRSKTTQSIVISHNRETMAVADVLYGVTMHADGTSHLYSVKLQDIASAHAQEIQV